MMEGGKKRLVAASVCVLVILLSVQQQSVAEDMSGFCRCYRKCYTACRLKSNRVVCKIACYLGCTGQNDHDAGCRRFCHQASVCDTAATGDDAITTEEAAICVGECATYRSRRGGKAEAKHG
ncbi:hypothetical protein VPH35_112473 [Triticum aestivum]